MNIVPITSLANLDWLRLRKALWPEGSDSEHKEEMARFLSEPSRFAQLLAYSESGHPIGFIEASVRVDYVNGTGSSPVAFLEGVYVEPGARRQGVASALVLEVAAWAMAHGCSELASDTQLENVLSQTVHMRLGFQETERVVYYKMALQSQNAVETLAQAARQRQSARERA